ncbi:MAG: DegT/DnrJ/EryC1/StrS family aminotransferase [Nitrospinota bacterium]
MFVSASPVPSFRQLADFCFGKRRDPSLVHRLLFPGMGAHGFSWFERGRTALLHALRGLRLGPSDWALLPAYLCPAVLVPFQESRIPYDFYPVTPDLGIDLDGVRAAVARRGPPRIALVIHYFGFPADVGGLVRCLEGEGGGGGGKGPAILIEDCAHGLFSRDGDVPLGARGDLSIFSLEKSLPLVRAGVLAVNGERVRIPPPRQGPPSALPGLKGVGKAVWYRLESALGWSPRSVLLSVDRLRHKVYEADARQPMDTARGIDPRVLSWCAGLDVASVVARRRWNYGFCAERLRECSGARLLRRELPAGVCPLGLPVVLERRDAVRRSCYRRGLALRTLWDVLPREVSAWEERTGNGAASLLRDRIALLPIHESLERRHLDYAIRVFLDELRRVRVGDSR